MATEGSSGPEAGPDRAPTEGGSGVSETDVPEELAEEEQDKGEEGAAQGGKGRVD